MAKLHRLRLGQNTSFLISGAPGNGEDGLACEIARRLTGATPTLVSSASLSRSGMLTQLVNKCYDTGCALIIDDRLSENFISYTEAPSFYGELSTSLFPADVPVIMMTSPRVAGRYSDLFTYNLQVKKADAHKVLEKLFGMNEPLGADLAGRVTVTDCFRLMQQLMLERRSRRKIASMDPAVLVGRLKAMVGMREEQKEAIRPLPGIPLDGQNCCG